MTDDLPHLPPTLAPPSRRNSNVVIPAVIAGAVGVILGVGGTLGVQAAGSAVSALTPTPTPTADTRLADAVAACGTPPGIALGDNDHSMTIDVKGKEDLTGATYEAQQCILRSLAAPSNVLSHLGQTTSMDGRQTETWDGITISWSYHPDRGADMVITVAPPVA